MSPAAAAELSRSLLHLERLRVSPPAAPVEAVDSAGSAAAVALMDEEGEAAADEEEEDTEEAALAAAAQRQRAAQRAAAHLASLKCLAAAFGSRLVLEQQ